MTTLYNELNKIDNRKKNMVVYGLEEAEEGGGDGAALGDLFQVIIPGSNPEYQTYRAGLKTLSRRRPLIVKFKMADL